MHDQHGAEQPGTIPTSELSAIAGGFLFPGGGAEPAPRGCSPAPAPKDFPSIKLPRFDPFTERPIPRDQLPLWSGLHGV